MAADGRQREEVGVRLAVGGRGEASASTGVPMLDHLLGLTARYGGLDLALEVAPGGVLAEVEAAGVALGQALAGFLRVGDARGHGSGIVPVGEALAHVALDASDRPLLVSNVDLTAVRLSGVGTDLVASFLDALARGAGLTLHVRLLTGDDAQHVLEAIFKALGVAIADAAARRG
jgi:imidazoleglycerol-phosphate dehydratase